MLALGCSTDPEPSGEPLPEVDGTPAHTDGLPSADTTSPDGRFTAKVERSGRLVLEGPSGPRELATGGVLHALAFSPDSQRMAWAEQASFPDSDLRLLDLAGNGEGDVQTLLDWPGPEDRPLFSPDGAQLAFVSGKTGWASVYVMDLASREVVQVTNEGVEDLPRKPGEAPEGFVPPPASNFTWTAEGLSWEADAQSWTVPSW